MALSQLGPPFMAGNEPNIFGYRSPVHGAYILLALAGGVVG
jgi:hypothetical protein